MELYQDCRELGRFMLRSGGTTIAAGVVTKVASVYVQSYILLRNILVLLKCTRCVWSLCGCVFNVKLMLISHSMVVLCIWGCQWVVPLYHT